MKKLIILFLLPFILFAQQQSDRTLFYDGNNREYILYVPENYDDINSLPVLFNFHGGNGLASDWLSMSDMRSLADTAGCILVYPQALGDPDDDGSFNWLHKGDTDHDDIYFIEAIIDALSSEFLIDNNRIYVCGYSLGGEFTYELLCRLNDRIAAGVAVARTMQQYQYDNCSPEHPTAIMTILGTDDFTSPYEGLVWGGETYYVSADDMHSYWVNYNNTNLDPIVNAIPNTNMSDGSTVDRRSWVDGDNCVSVEELRVNNGGHDWPGVFGNMDIDSNIEIWNFVSQYDINGLINCDNFSSIEQIELINNKVCVQIIDILGRLHTGQFDSFLFYIYNDGSIEKKYILK